ncbi:MAG TPA: cytidylate kinase-like family protein [Prolixibacteraceae bacterium]|nr:cytidylate kinase-like family protein [Prolixibacteraceae bacterium]
MSNIFLEYMSKRISEMNLDDHIVAPGPVITISRAAGCIAEQMAINLAHRLNKLQQTNKWNLISKEILHKTAEKLNIHPKKVELFFKMNNHSLLDGIMLSFLSKDYQLERKVRNTLISVIHRFGAEGHSIIMGRGSSTICSDIENALHVRIDAPLDWRIKKIMKMKNYNRDDAKTYVIDTENDRVGFRKAIKRREVKCNEFDITINKSVFSDNEIIEIIITALKMKKII